MSIWAWLGIIVALIAAIGGETAWVYHAGGAAERADCEQEHRKANADKQSKIDEQAARDLAEARQAAALAAAERDKLRGDFNGLKEEYQKLRNKRIPTAAGLPGPLVADSSVCILSDGVRNVWNRANAGGAQTAPTGTSSPPALRKDSAATGK